MEKDFLPISREDMKKRGWSQCDFVYISGDAYVDHSSFGAAIITRLLESRGYKVGIIAQPDWKNKESIAVLGEPRLGFLVSAGNMDSMVNHYTVNKKRRKNVLIYSGSLAQNGLTASLLNLLSCLNAVVRSIFALFGISFVRLSISLWPMPIAFPTSRIAARAPNVPKVMMLQT